MGFFNRSKNKLRKKAPDYYLNQVIRAGKLGEYWGHELTRQDNSKERVVRICNHIRRIRKVQILCDLKGRG